jgi:hypothetical protein
MDLFGRPPHNRAAAEVDTDADADALNAHFKQG